MRELQQRIVAEMGVRPEIDPAAEVERRVQFLADYLQVTGAAGFVLGISGGVDSTAGGRLAQLAVERVRAQSGPDDADSAPSNRPVFTAVRLPYKEQADESDAADAMEFIGADEPLTVNIAAATLGLGEAFAAGTGEEISDYNNGNVKARMRMVTQYALAGRRGQLVIGTDHGAESITGFFTKFGDGAADVLPLFGLNKRQVRAVAKELGAPEHLWNKVPTADLLDDNPGRTDEDELGLRYDDIDDYLEGREIDPEVAEKLEGIWTRSRHKRTTPVTILDEWWR
ncbi:MAG: ammonia-dependent NAD(+) synthetase [Micrococcus sp.]|nr:ammonia-dependent NAD(+) synthetase [Micrococcus sp.]